MNQSNQIPLEDFFKNPEKSAYKLSPAGDWLAYLAPYENRKNIFVQKIGDSQALRISNQKDRDLNDFFWKNDEKLLYVRDFGGDENFHLFAVNKDGSGEQDLTPFAGVKVELIDDLEDEPDFVLIGLNKRNPQIFDPYKLNINTGELSLQAENQGNITTWITDHKGEIRVAIATDGVNNSILYRENSKQAFQTVLTTNFKETVAPLYFDFDNSSRVYALSNLNRDKSAIVKMDLATGKEVELIFEHPEVDASYMSYSRSRKVPTTISFITWKKEFKFLDSKVAQLYQRLSQELGKYEIAITSTNKAEDRFIIRTFSDRSMGSFYLYDQKTDKLEKLSEVSPWLKEADLCEMKPISYTSRDGKTIHGYLTLPKGDGKNLPVVINPHGGPWARDVWTFNPEIQFLANRGYAVLQMNFRGSTGYGREFWQSSFKQWGLAMQNDISDGVEWLIKEGIADKKRVAIYGGSYGGYATLAGVAFSPELYACAVDYVGVSNLFTFLNTIPEYWEPYRAALYEMVGNPKIEADSLRMRATSPIFHIDKIKAPLFIAQGANDPRVKQSESDQIVEALRAQNVEVEYLLKTNEGHGFRNQENKFEFYTKMEAFLGQHLQNR